MRLDNYTYYGDYKIDSSRGVICSLFHFIEVWNDGYLVDEHIICDDGIAFESAYWETEELDDRTFGTRISQQEYERWVNRIEGERAKIKELMYQQGVPLTRKVEIGDYILISEEESEMEGDRLRKEEAYTLINVEDIHEEGIIGSGITINKHDTSLWLDSMFDKEDYDFERGLFIFKETFEKAKVIIESLSSELLAEMQKRLRIKRK